MAALIGRHTNRIDKKGRVSVPKAFRDALLKPVLEEPAIPDLFSGIYLYRSFKYPSIEGCGEMFIQRIIDSLDELELFSDEQDDLAVTLLENSYEIAYDTEGRILLPAELRAYAGLCEEAVFVGRGTRFQIWEPEAYKAYNHKAFERIKAQGATLKLRTFQDGFGL
jgi:MraZ protein